MDAHLDLELSAYLDGDLAASELARAEAHLAACGECRTALEELKQLVRHARALDDTAPARDLWAGIARRIATVPRDADVVPITSRRRVSFTMPQLAAAAVALMALSAGAVSVAMQREAPAQTAALAPAANGGVTGIPVTARQVTEASYDSVIGELQRSLDERRGQLDTATVRVLEQTLDVINAAIAQALAALENDPNNQYLNQQLQRTLDRKLHLLQRAATLPAVS